MSDRREGEFAKTNTRLAGSNGAGLDKGQPVRLLSGVRTGSDGRPCHVVEDARGKVHEVPASAIDSTKTYRRG